MPRSQSASAMPTSIPLGIQSHAVGAADRAAEKVWNDAMADVIDVGKKTTGVRSTAKYCTEVPKLKLLLKGKLI